MSGLDELSEVNNEGNKNMGGSDKMGQTRYTTFLNRNYKY